MSEEYKNRVKKAMEKWSEKNDPTIYRERRTNNQPERILVGHIMIWLKANKFDCNIFESKATYSPFVERYISQSMPQGTSDIVGNDKNGMAVYIEVKAPGLCIKSKLRLNQREFLVSKINTNCFATVTDSVDRLEKSYNKWISILDKKGRRDFLLSLLP